MPLETIRYRLNQLVTCPFPSFDTTEKNFGLLVTHFNLFDCQTDSGPVVGSSTVEDDFLIFGQ